MADEQIVDEDEVVPDYKQIILSIRSTAGDRRWLVPPEFRARLVEIAAERGSNMTDVAVELLCEHYGMEYDPTGRRSTPGSERDKITLRLPIDLHRAVSASAGANYPQLSPPREVIRVLCAKLGIGETTSAHVR